MSDLVNNLLKEIKEREKEIKRLNKDINKLEWIIVALCVACLFFALSDF